MPLGLAGVGGTVVVLQAVGYRDEAVGIHAVLYRDHIDGDTARQKRVRPGLSENPRSHSTGGR